MELFRFRAQWLALILTLAPVLFAGEWPQWRGPGRDGIWMEQDIVERFEESGPTVLWRVPVSGGYSGVTVAAGRVYTMDRMKEPEQIERILCFDAETGKQVWSYQYPAKYKIGYPVGPRASVTIDDKRAYAFGAMGHFHCFDAETGQVLWSKDFKAEYDSEIPTWGMSCSPLIEGNLVILQIDDKEGACVVALDKKTGDEIWRAIDDKVNYSSPIMIDQAGKRVLITWTVEQISGLDVQTGQVLWQQLFSAEMGIASPVLYEDYLFVSSFFDGSILLKLDDKKTAVEVVWQRKGEDEKETDSLHSCISTPVILDGYIYGVDSYGELRCLDLLTGDRVWENNDAVKGNRWANIYMVQNGDNTWMFNENGELLIGQLRPDGFKEISRALVIKPTGRELAQRGGVCWAHPAYAYKNTYVRNDEELICIGLAAKPKADSP